MKSSSGPPYVRSPLRSEEKIRTLDADSLGLSAKLRAIEYEIKDTNSYLVQVQQLLASGFAGVIFVGPPGTSKSWYAAQIAARLVDKDSERARFIQFHASYQYEDFMEGYVPREDGSGFDLVPKHFLEMCGTAEDAAGKLCVIVIDELSRSDPARVFGEALTYVEMTKRDIPFRLASGKEASVPPNLIFLATMNPMDRGVDEVDAALERRFAKIAMDPDPRILDQFLTANMMDDALRERVISFFNWLLKNDNRQSRVGHAYFYSVKSEDDLRRLWNHQLRFHFEKAFRLNEEGLHEVERAWGRIFPAAATTTAGSSGGAEDNPDSTAVAPEQPAETAPAQTKSSNGGASTGGNSQAPDQSTAAENI